MADKNLILPIVSQGNAHLPQPHTEITNSRILSLKWFVPGWFMFYTYGLDGFPSHPLPPPSDCVSRQHTFTPQSYTEITYSRILTLKWFVPRSYPPTAYRKHLLKDSGSQLVRPRVVHVLCLWIRFCLPVTSFPFCSRHPHHLPKWKMMSIHV